MAEDCKKKLPDCKRIVIMIPHSYHVYYKKKGELSSCHYYGFTTPRQDKMTRKEFLLDVINLRRLIGGSNEISTTDFKNWHIIKD